MVRQLEICVDSLQSALTAEEGGANRIELCSGLELGGLTPDPALFKLVKEKLSIPVFVLIRPRMGGFVYDHLDREVMGASIRYFKEMGADGLVLGALTDEGEVDQPLMQKFIQLASPLPVTFHRAFDQIPDPTNELPKLLELGVKRILTSGQQAKAVLGLDLLRKINDLVEDKIIILAGGGVASQNVERLLNIGFNEVHASARISAKPENRENSLSLSQGEISDAYRFADLQEIITLRKILDEYDTIST
ncbi:MAG: copper homeostasis protein CutC [Cyclobacteriaceae bacterium]